MFLNIIIITISYSMPIYYVLSKMLMIKKKQYLNIYTVTKETMFSQAYVTYLHMVSLVLVYILYIVW